MAGGMYSNRLDTVEMINLETMSSCIVDVNLDQPRHAHTGDGNLVCGGNGNGNIYISSCFNVATRTSINLTSEISHHVSWSTSDGIYLLGGEPSSNYRTTELITGDTTQAGFGLKYNTR